MQCNQRTQYGPTEQIRCDRVDHSSNGWLIFIHDCWRIKVVAQKFLLCIVTIKPSTTEPNSIPYYAMWCLPPTMEACWFSLNLGCEKWKCFWNENTAVGYALPVFCALYITLNILYRICLSPSLHCQFYLASCWWIPLITTRGYRIYRTLPRWSIRQ